MAEGIVEECYLLQLWDTKQGCSAREEEAGDHTGNTQIYVSLTYTDTPTRVPHQRQMAPKPVKLTN